MNYFSWKLMYEICITTLKKIIQAYLNAQRQHNAYICLIVICSQFVIYLFTLLFSQIAGHINRSLAENIFFAVLHENKTQSRLLHYLVEYDIRKSSNITFFRMAVPVSLYIYRGNPCMVKLIKSLSTKRFQ